MSVTIRLAVQRDETALAQLSSMVQALHVAARPDIFVPVRPDDLVDWFRDVLDSRAHSIWLAVEDGVPVGYLLAVIHDRPATAFTSPRRWCEINQLGVADDMRGRGIARALVNSAIAWARELGIPRVSTQCWSFNGVAQETFARLGFGPMTVRLERALDV